MKMKKPPSQQKVLISAILHKPYGFNFNNNFNFHFNFPKSSVLFKINSTSKVILQLVIHYPHWEYYYSFLWKRTYNEIVGANPNTHFQKCSN